MVRDEGFLHLVSSDQNPQDPSSWISSKPQPIPNTNLRCPTTRVHRSALANSLIRRSGWARGTRSRVHDGQQAALGGNDYASGILSFLDAGIPAVRIFQQTVGAYPSGSLAAGRPTAGQGA